MLGGQSSTVPDSAHAAALSTTDPVLDATMHPADATAAYRSYPAGATAPQYRIHERKKRTASAETLAQFEQAEALRELVLIFDTSKGKRGAYGGLGHDTREAQEAARSTQASRARSPRSLRL